nr:unnamed protein product [Callosobruchus analis]
MATQTLKSRFERQEGHSEKVIPQPFKLEKSTQTSKYETIGWTVEQTPEAIKLISESPTVPEELKVPETKQGEEGASEIVQVKAGCLKDFYYQWRLITTDSTILSWIKGYRIKFSRIVRQLLVSKESMWGVEEHKKLKPEIQHLLQIGAISSCNPDKDQHFSKVIAVLVSICPAVKYGWLYLKRCERFKTLSLRSAQGDYNASIESPRYVYRDILWWISNIPICKKEIAKGNYDITIYTDASTTGWGCVCGSAKVFGHWSD